MRKIDPFFHVDPASIRSPLPGVDTTLKDDFSSSNAFCDLIVTESRSLDRRLTGTGYDIL